MELDEQTLRYLPRIAAIVRGALHGIPCSIWLFGSRATGGASPVSDFDLAVWADEDVFARLVRAREELEESTIPFRVDVVDLREAPETLAEEVRRKGILVWTS
jgi:predicted nucleotidyltransferase